MRLFLVLIQFLFFACTIIEDTDITSQQELDNLKLESIEIKQDISGGTGNPTTTSIIKATLISESIVSINAANGKITRQVWMNWPILNSKLKLKGGSTSTFKSCTSFLETGKPGNFCLVNSNSDTLEFYRFWYDSKSRLNRIVAFIGSDSPTNDTLIYNNPNNSSELTSIIRRSTDPSKAGTFSISNGSTTSFWYSFEFKGIRYTKSCQDCGNQYWGGNYNVVNQSTSIPFGVLNLVDSPGQFSVQDLNKNVSTQYCQGNCKQGSDTYYLHPLMILKDQFDLGSTLLFFYMVDWVQPTSTNESTTDEQITFTFKYDL